MSLSWIPQLFYDLLARLLPGIVLLILAALLARGWGGKEIDIVKWFWSYGFGYYGSPAAALAVAYVLGLVLAEVWEILVRGLVKNRKSNMHSAVAADCLQEHNNMFKELERSEETITTDGLPSILAMQEHLRPVSNESVIRLLRLRSDLRVCHVLFVGFLILFICNLVLCCIHKDNGIRIAVSFAFPLSAIALFHRAMRLERFMAVATCIAWLECVMEGGLLFSRSGGDDRTKRV